MSFFVTSQSLGKGADLGGLAGADAHCQALAASVGAGGKTWHAYLSTQGPGAVNARDRIGKGPWVNAKGVIDRQETSPTCIAPTTNSAKRTTCRRRASRSTATATSRTGTISSPARKPDGTAFPPDKDMTCKNWTSSTRG